MGCSHSKLDDEEAVQICKDRKKFIKQAMEHRTRFASTHIIYIQSLRKVSEALNEFINGDNKPHEFPIDSFITPTKQQQQIHDEFITISPSSIPKPKLIQPKSRSRTKMQVNYLMASGSRPVRVEERPPRSPETFRVESYNQYGSGDGFFGMNMNMNTSSPPSSSFWNPLSSPDQPRLSSHSHNIPPPSPQNSQWDFFWNPFSSLDYYGYGYDRGSIDPRSGIDDEIKGLRRVREEEGIPDLEEDEPEPEPELPGPQPVRFQDHKMKTTEINRGKLDHSCNEEVTVEDVDEDEDEEDEEEDEEFTDSGCETGTEDEGEDCCVGVQEQRNSEVCRGQSTGHVVGVEKAQEMKKVVGVTDEVKGEPPGFTVYVNRRPTSMAEVIKDLEDQFTAICDVAKEVSGMLEASKAQYVSPTSEHSAMKMLNPVALFRSGSSRSSSSRFLISSSGESRSDDVSDESCMLSGSHQTTLDRLYAWEKKLYDEVRSGERVRRAYEKKCMQLRNQDVKGDDPLSVDKTRATMRDLDTQIKVSIHSIEAISKRIETLRDQELLPQLLELVQGLTKMWKVMAECHQIQKRTLDEAKLLLAGTQASKRHKKRQPSFPEANPQRLAQSALHLEAQLRNWRGCFEAWITSQRFYMQGLASWLLRCFRCDPDPEKVRLSSCPHPIYQVCIQWARLLNSLNEKPVLEKLEFFASGMGSIYARQLREDPNWSGSGSRRYSGSESLELVVADKVEEVMTPEKLAEVAVKVLCHGMSVAVSSLAEFAISSADEHSKLISQPEEAAPGQRPGPEPGQRPGPEPGQRPSPEPGQRPGRQPGQRPVPEPGQRPDPEPGQRPDPEPGQRPDPEPGQRPGREPGQRPGREPGQRPGREPGQRPGREPWQRPRS